MKPLPCLADLILEVITPTHPRWNEAIKLVDERYQQAFDAHLTAYMPAYLALLDKQVMKSVCGYRIAEQEPLFLEQNISMSLPIVFLHNVLHVRYLVAS